MPAPVVAAAIIGASGLAAAGIGAAGASSAAKAQMTAEQSAAATQLEMFNKTQANLAPFTSAGQDATAKLAAYDPFQFNPTQAQLEQTPGYQFVRSQGLKSVQNGYAAQGLGTSGAAQKGAADYAEGLAGTTYQNMFQNALNSYTTNVGRLQDIAHTGESAAANTGTFATATGQGIGQTAVGAANASAAGTVGVANAASAGVGSLANAYLYNNFFKQNQPGVASIYGSTNLPASTTAYNTDNFANG